MIHLIGGGGHCKVVIDTLLAGGVGTEDLRVRDGRANMQDREVLGVRIDCPEIDDRLTGQPVHVAIGANSARSRLFVAAVAAGGQPVTVRHPSAQVSASARIEAGCFIGALVAIGPDADIGRDVIVNHGAVVEHDCIVGDHAFLGSHATLGGGVRIGELATIGPGAVVPTGRTVGARATVAPGAVVTRDLYPDEKWTGALAPTGTRDA